MQIEKIAFLDRDGVLNEEIGNYVTQIDDFKILPHTINNCLAIKKLGFQIVIVTNQGGLAKKLYTEEALESFHQKLQSEFINSGIIILDIFYCPHHSEVENCICRKPKGGMLERGLAKYGGIKEKCFMIGDNIRDVNAALSAGIDQAYEIKSNEDWITVLQNIIA